MEIRSERGAAAGAASASETALHGNGERSENTHYNSAAQDGIVVGTFRKNRSGACIRVALKQYEGHDFVDVREFFPGEGGRQYLPTKKGIGIRPSLLDDLIRLLSRARDEAEQRGMLRERAP